MSYLTKMAYDMEKAAAEKALTDSHDAYLKAFYTNDPDLDQAYQAYLDAKVTTEQWRVAAIDRLLQGSR